MRNGTSEEETEPCGDEDGDTFHSWLPFVSVAPRTTRLSRLEKTGGLAGRRLGSAETEGSGG